jgi:hypothetical protein
MLFWLSWKSNCTTVRYIKLTEIYDNLVSLLYRHLVLFLQMPVEIEDACSMLPAHKHYKHHKKSHHIITIAFINNLWLVLNVC